MDLTHLSAGEALLICLLGFLIVFAILIIISLCIRLNSWIIGKIESRGKKKDKTDNPSAPNLSASPVNSEALSDEEFTVIVAAVSAAMGVPPDRLIIRDIRPAQDAGSSWAVSSRMNNKEE